ENSRLISMQSWQRCGCSTNVGKWPPAPLDLGSNFPAHNSAESAGGDIHKIASLLAAYPNNVDRVSPACAQNLNVILDLRRQTDRAGKIIPSPERQNSNPRPRSRPGRAIYHLI